jgi:hypothetical protein
MRIGSRSRRAFVVSSSKVFMMDSIWISVIAVMDAFTTFHNNDYKAASADGVGLVT